MSYNTIIYEVDDKVLTITLNRPEKLNAFTGEMQSELIDALDRADADDNVRAIIVTGAGLHFALVRTCLLAVTRSNLLSVNLVRLKSHEMVAVCSPYEYLSVRSPLLLPSTDQLLAWVLPCSLPWTCDWLAPMRSLGLCLPAGE